MIGQLVRSKAGHDKDEIYLVVDRDAKNSQFVYVANGKEKLRSSSKRKNIKHLQVINGMAIEKARLDEMKDEEIKRHIKLYKESREKISN